MVRPDTKRKISALTSPPPLPLVESTDSSHSTAGARPSVLASCTPVTPVGSSPFGMRREVRSGMDPGPEGRMYILYSVHDSTAP
jgi:hypothetical protein